MRVGSKNSATADSSSSSKSSCTALALPHSDCSRHSWSRRSRFKDGVIFCRITEAQGRGKKRLPHDKRLFMPPDNSTAHQITSSCFRSPLVIETLTENQRNQQELQSSGLGIRAAKDDCGYRQGARRTSLARIRIENNGERESESEDRHRLPPKKDHGGEFSRSLPAQVNYMIAGLHSNCRSTPVLAANADLLRGRGGARGKLSK